jgi:hypothetical protein
MRMNALARLAVLLGLLLPATGAGAAGGLSPGTLWGAGGVVAPGGAVRYVALPAGPTTVVAAIRVRGGAVLRPGTLRGVFGIPLVAYDGSAGGLSADGRTLVLSTLPAQRANAGTRFAVFTPRTLRRRALVALPGSFSYDALSPDGSTLYVIRYHGRSPNSRYSVRAVNLRTGNVLPGSIVDKREPDEAMQGQPVSRATRRDGAWAYTLYRRDAGRAFLHALDTVHRTAVCVDLPWTDPRGALWNARLALEGRRLSIRQAGVGTLATVDIRTFAVRTFRRPVASP